MHEITAAYFFEANGSSKRRNRTLLDAARTLLLGMDVPRNDLWAEAIHTASLLRNRSLKKKLSRSQNLLGSNS